MNIKSVKDELKNILSGKGSVSNGTLIQATTNYLRKSTPASGMVETKQQNKEKETEELVEYINSNNLWNCDIDFSLFISAGAEQRVYVLNNNKVLKLNDAIYYTSWIDYLNNLLLNNYFFPDTAYKLLGFHKSDVNIIYALVEQNYVAATQPTDLSLVKQFLVNNGFINNKNHDYYHPDLGIILEDLHDENVLTQNEVLFLKIQCSTSNQKYFGNRNFAELC